MLGGMQDWDLRVTHLIDYAEREHGTREIVTRWADGSVERTNWAGVASQARRMAQAFVAMGMKPADRGNLCDEPSPPSCRLVWCDRLRRGDPHRQRSVVR
jgi:acyl-CoA synthetase (AMP-forming)/AMP-acid ligase II